MTPSVAVLFARADSVYKTLSGCDVFDAERDARTWTGGGPGVFHPPCRGWGALAWRANCRDDEKELAVWSVGMLRKWGGVLEHPATSKLWEACELPAPNRRDAFGGWTLAAPQFWWGHRANKATRFYIVGCSPADVPEIPFKLGEAEFVIGDVGRAGKGKRPEIPKAERERTPPELAAWLVELARRCKVTRGQ